MSGTNALADVARAAAQDQAGGRPVDALMRLAPLLGTHTQDPQAYHLVTEALIAALEQPSRLALWARDEKATCYWRLLAQTECQERPFVLAHMAAKLLTSNNVTIAKRLIRELAGILRDMLGQKDVERGLVIFLLVGRSQVGDALPQAGISALHRAWFSQFSNRDFDLPYNGLFFPKIFGRNLDEVNAIVGDAPAVYVRTARSMPSQALFVEWATGRPVCVDPDNQDLADLLSTMAGNASCPAETSAARALVVKHWTPRGVLDKAALEACGIGAGVLEFAQARPDLQTGGRETGRIERLQKKHIQALHSARTLLPFPAPAMGRKRLRIAVCLSGQLRGWQAAHTSWKRHLFAGAETDIFVHTWAATGSPSPHPVRQVLPFEGKNFTAAWRRLTIREGYDIMMARYPALLGALAVDSVVSAEALRQAYKARCVVIEDDADASFQTYSNQDKMHYKIWAAHELAEAAARTDGIDLHKAYDLVVRLRPDLPVNVRSFSWADMAAACRESPVVFAEKGVGIHYGNLLMGDQFAVGAPKTMRVYANTWKTYPDLAALDIARCPAKLTGHLSLAMTCWWAGIKTMQVPARFGKLCNPAVLANRQIRHALEADMQGRLDSVDRDLVEALRKDGA